MIVGELRFGEGGVLRHSVLRHDVPWDSKVLLRIMPGQTKQAVKQAALGGTILVLTQC